MIDVLKLKGLDQEAMVKMLNSNGKQSFEIGIPAIDAKPGNKINEIAFNYLRAAYAGQELSEVSEYFQYDPDAPATLPHISFNIRCKDIHGLALRLIGITYLYGQPNASSDHGIAQVINSLLDRIRNRDVELACGEFIEYYMDYSLMQDTGPGSQE